MTTETLNTLIGVASTFGIAITIALITNVSRRARLIDDRLSNLEKSVAVLIANYESIVKRIDRQETISDQQIASDNSKK